MCGKGSEHMHILHFFATTGLHFLSDTAHPPVVIDVVVRAIKSVLGLG